MWGPYLSGRQWGTVREDYSENGDAWGYFPFEQAEARAYRWGEDGLGGICDRFGFLNFSVALWNGQDSRLKERLFGLTNPEGNHGEDVKEYWWAVDATPTHSYGQWLYRYPQAAYPYSQLRSENAHRDRAQAEYELSDTGVLADDRFFDIAVSYAKAAPDDICIRITATNHGPAAAPLHLLPQLWFRNTWAWGQDDRTPQLRRIDPPERVAGPLRAVEAEHGFLGRYLLLANGEPDVLVCDNESDTVRLFGTAENPSKFPKDGIGRRVVQGEPDTVNPAGTGTKAAFWYKFDSIASGESVTVELRLSAEAFGERPFGPSFDTVFADRIGEADEFYASVIPTETTAVDQQIARRAFAGLLWGKQLYRYSVAEWIDGDPAQPAPPAARAERGARNSSWRQLSLADVISMPDEWEYPWFASWDLAFHCVTLAHIDPAFAKDQLVLLCREWAMHPNGQLPAYEWAFGDVNPPVHAWAAWRVYCIDGSGDRGFLMRVFSKLLLNFSWWVNRKDADGSNLFEGGFLGMDNIGLFDRSAPLPPGHRLEQSDATSWMAFYCLSMLQIALELARTDPAWDDLATKFLEHFLSIAQALSAFGSQNVELWDEQDGFCYDVLVLPDGSYQRLPVRSMVGLLPLLSVALAPDWVATELPDFTSRLNWLFQHRPALTASLVTARGTAGTHLTLALLDSERYQRVLHRMLDEQEFLSPYGIRSLSAAYREPFSTQVEGHSVTIAYNPGESDSGLFGGNSNWRGPVWFPVNVLLADALRTYCAGQGTDLSVEMPTGSGETRPLREVADLLHDRLIALFRPGPDGRRPSDPRDVGDGPLWYAHPTFSEYFNGDSGIGLGASHQTGWTALVAHLICDRPAD
ncbi:MAG: glucosidase [Actinomycetota bacterium]|nr:glucosidase [Actinomycetota bacterium]MDQ2956683.1 glucosidase [Actinomycetota bacterium]